MWFRILTVILAYLRRESPNWRIDSIGWLDWWLITRLWNVSLHLKCSNHLITILHPVDIVCYNYEFSGVKLLVNLGDKLIVLRIILLTCWGFQFTSMFCSKVLSFVVVLCVCVLCVFNRDVGSWFLLVAFVSCLSFVSGSISLAEWVCKSHFSFNPLSNFRRLVNSSVLTLSAVKTAGSFVYWKTFIVALVLLLIIGLVRIPVLPFLYFSRLFVCKHSPIIPGFPSWYELSVYNCH